MRRGPRRVDARRCGRAAAGDRSSFANTIRGRMMSSAKFVWPVTLARPSTRRRGMPMTLGPEVIRSSGRGPAPAGCSDGYGAVSTWRLVTHHRRRGFHGVENLLIAGAAADDAGEGLANLLARGLRIALEQGRGREQHPRRAVAALGRAAVGERRLQWMKPRAVRHPFDRLDVDVPSHASPSIRQERMRLAVQEDGAGAALAELAAMFGAGQIADLRAAPRGASCRLEGDFDSLAVDRSRTGTRSKRDGRRSSGPRGSRG